MASRDEIYDAIRAADANGDREGVLKLSAYLQQMDAPEPQPEVSPSRKAGAEFVKQSPLAPLAGINQALQGATFGFSDELGGALNVLRNPLQPVKQYQEGRDYLRGVSEQFKQEYPASALIGDVSGGLLYGGPFKAAATAMSAGKNVGTLGRLGQATALGAGAGATAGAGGAETLADVPFEALKHGAFGAAASPTLQGIGMGVRGGAQALTPFFTGAGARNVAQQRVANAIAQDQRTSGQVTARMGKLGEEGRIADAAGQSTRDLLDTMATLPGTTRDKVEQFIRMRQIGRPERMDVLPDALNQGRRATPTLDALQKYKEQQSRPLYKAVENKVVPITPTLESLMDRPAFKEAFDQAVTNAANRGEHLPLLDDLLKQGPVSGIKVKFWDDVKRGLDDVIGNKKRGLQSVSPSNKNQAQSTLQSSLDIKHELVDEVDRLTRGAYKRARDAYAGPAALQSALEDGTAVWKLKPSEITQTLGKLSDSEQEAFRIGAGEVLREKVGSQVGQGQLLNAWKDRNMREKLQAIYGDERSYRRAMSRLLAENELRRLEATGRGSQTARREAGVEDFNLGAVTDAAASVKSGNIAGMLDAVRKASSRVSTPEPVRNEIGRLLLQGGQGGRDELARLDAIIRAIKEKNAGQTAITGVVGSSVFPF